MRKTYAKLRVFVDADVLFAGSASPSDHGASLLVLRLGELTLFDASTSEQVVAEVKHNLPSKMPDALPLFRLLVYRDLKVMRKRQASICMVHHADEKVSSYGRNAGRPLRIAASTPFMSLRGIDKAVLNR